MIPQTPWIERKFNFDFPPGLFPVIIERLRGTIPRLETMVKGRKETELLWKKEGKWSAKEIIGHLYELDKLWDQRVTDFLDKKQILTAADMSNAGTKAAGFDHQPIGDLLTVFGERRLTLLQRVSNFSEEKAVLTALHPRLQKPMRLVDSLFFAAEHDDHELTRMRMVLTGNNPF